MIKVYKGRYTSYTDQVLTINNGKVYKGWSTSDRDQILTVENGKVYKGWSTSDRDQILTIEGWMSIEEFVAIWYAAAQYLL